MGSWWSASSSSRRRSRSGPSCSLRTTPNCCSSPVTETSSRRGSTFHWRLRADRGPRGQGALCRSRGSARPTRTAHTGGAALDGAPAGARTHRAGHFEALATRACVGRHRRPVQGAATAHLSVPARPVAGTGHCGRPLTAAGRGVGPRKPHRELPRLRRCAGRHRRRVRRAQDPHLSGGMRAQLRAGDECGRRRACAGTCTDRKARVARRGKVRLQAGTGRGLLLLEVNPRFNLWHHLGAVAGVNLPALVYGDAVGRPRPPMRAARAGVRWLRPSTDRRAAKASGISLASWLSFAARCEAKSVLAWDDPMPVFGRVAQQVVARWRRVGGSAMPLPGKR